MIKIQVTQALDLLNHESQKIKTQAKQAVSIYNEIHDANPERKKFFVLDGANRPYLCVEREGSDFVVMIYDNWERCFKCQVLPGASKVGVSIVYPPAMQRTKTLSPAKIRKEIERAILINERYKAAQEVKRAAIEAMKTKILDNGGTVENKLDGFSGTIERGGLQMVVSHVFNDQFIYQINVLAAPTIDNFIKMANNALK
jgi:hypothetical protein